MKNHVLKVCIVSLCSVEEHRYPPSIRKVLPREIAVTVGHVSVTSRLGYCNAIFYCLPACTMSKLQRIQNSAARVVHQSRESDHITPILHDLHWLPVSDRIIFKVLAMSYQALRCMAPDNISDLVRHVPARSLWSATDNLLSVPTSRSQSFADRRFAYATSTLWNGLPLEIRNARTLTKLKSFLRTHVFNKPFMAWLLLAYIPSFFCFVFLVNRCSHCVVQRGEYILCRSLRYISSYLILFTIIILSENLFVVYVNHWHANWMHI